MTRYLITQSLISSWYYVHDCTEGYEDAAMASFLQTLRRQKLEPNEAILNGIAFENAVYAEAEKQPRPINDKWEPGIRRISSMLEGAQFQVRVSRRLEAAKMSFLVYGVLDALRAGTIYDVKFKNKSLGSIDAAGSYLESPQHPLYFYCVPEALEFRYIVSDGKDVYCERYTPAESRSAKSVIEDFVSALRVMDLLDTYKQYWEARP